MSEGSQQNASENYSNFSTTFSQESVQNLIEEYDQCGGSEQGEFLMRIMEKRRHRQLIGKLLLGSKATKRAFLKFIG